MPKFCWPILIALTITGCRNNEPSIFGTWQSSATSQANRILTISPTSIDIQIQAMGQTVNMTGDLTQSKNRLTIKNLKLPPDLKAAAQSSGTNLDLPQTINATFSFKNENEVVISGTPLIEGAYTREEQN